MVEARVLAAWLRETDRPPLPSGDALSWSILTMGTLLEGASWPGWSFEPGRHGGGIVMKRRAAGGQAAAEGLAAPASLAAYVVARLEAAGRTLYCLPQRGAGPLLRTANLDIVRSAAEVAMGDPAERIRLPVPGSARIDEMDEAYAWLSLIPQGSYVLRRIVGARSLVNPVTERHLFSWRRLGGMLGADHRAVPRWHAEGIGHIVAGLAGRVSLRDAA